MESQMFKYSATLADLSDLPEILMLQKRAFASEAEALDDPNIEPLTQTLEQATADARRGVLFKICNENGAIIGSVRAYRDDEGVHIGKLIVEPAYWGKNLGGILLDAIEQFFGNGKYLLFTRADNVRNMHFYEKHGYCPTHKKFVTHNLEIAFLEKFID